MKSLVVSAALLLVFTSSNGFPSLDDEGQWLGDMRLLEPLPQQAEAVQSLDFARKTPLHKLKSMFDSGTEPTFKEVLAWRPGRCYFADKPALAIPSALVSTSQKETVSMDGPAFAGDVSRKPVAIIARKQSPQYFDQIGKPNGKKLAYSIRDFIRANQNDLSFPTRTNASLRVDIPRSMKRDASSYLIRKSDRYLVLKLICSDGYGPAFGGCRNQVGNRYVYEENDLVAYCYYFRQ